MQSYPDRRRALTMFGVGAAAGLMSGAGKGIAGEVVASGNAAAQTPVRYKTVNVGGVEVFYREAGPESAPVILLLHGYPTSSHMFRELIPELAGSFRLIAPDLPGFGLTKAPDRQHYAYTFDNLAKTIDGFTDVLNLNKYALYVFDYGAPTGFRIAAAHPERVTAIITQNGNAYEEGLGDAWAPIRAYWKDATPENRNALRAVLTLEATKDQYLHGADGSLVSPDGYMLDYAYLQRPGIDDIQLDLFYDYRSNVCAVPRMAKILPTKQAATTGSLGARTMSSSSHQAQKHSGAIFQMRRLNLSTAVTLRLRHTAPISLSRSPTSCAARRSCRRPSHDLICLLPSAA